MSRRALALRFLSILSLIGRAGYQARDISALEDPFLWALKKTIFNFLLKRLRV
jgi:hypothetical protein